MGAETRYHPNAEQLALAGTLDESLATLLPLSRLHGSTSEEAATWAALDEIGVFGISLSEEQGGSGLGAAEEALIVMSLGRHLASPGILATLGAAHAGASHGRPQLQGRRVAAGYQRGERVVVIQDPQADLVLLRQTDAAGVFELGSAATTPVDERLWLAGLRETYGLGAPLARFGPAEVLRLRLIDAAVLAGLSQAALDMSVAYAGIRSQFGRPIGSFQAVKHHCANMAIAARCARDQTGFAAVALDEGRPDAALQVECALLVAGSAAIDNSGLNIQIHGGIGFSDEADPHLVLKRARLQIALAGGLEAAHERIANIRTGW